MAIIQPDSDNQKNIELTEEMRLFLVALKRGLNFTSAQIDALLCPKKNKIVLDIEKHLTNKHEQP